MPERKHNFIKGAMILTAATMTVKVLGMLYKIPLGNILGAVGMSYFMTAYNIFTPIYALSVSGLPVAASKMVAESHAKQNYRETKKIFRCSYGLFIALGVTGFAVMFFGADKAASLVNNPDAAMAVRAMAPAVFFCCIVSAYRGYYQGLGNMVPTAVSQILESFFKLVCGIAFAWIMLQGVIRGYEAGAFALGGKTVTRSEAEMAALPWAAAGAILGVTASSVASALYLTLRHAIRGDGMKRMPEAPPAETPRALAIMKRLAWLSLPVCIGSALTQVTSLIDVVTVMNRVGAAFLRDGDAILSMYRGLIPPGVTNDVLPKFLYGAYGYCLSLFNLVPALTIPLGISALPMLSSQRALGNATKAASQAQSVIKLSSIVAIPAGLGLSALAFPILALLYPARVEEVALAAPMLRSLGLAAAFMGVTAPMSSIFQAAGRADIPVKLMAIGAALKLAINYFLIAIPRLNINAAPYGTVLCCFFIFIASVAMLQNVLNMRIDLINSFFKPLICGIICAVTAHTSYGLLNNLIKSRILCLISIGIGGTIYLVFLLILRIITKNEVLLLPYGENISKKLEKLSLLG